MSRDRSEYEDRVERLADELCKAIRGHEIRYRREECARRIRAAVKDLLGPKDQDDEALEDVKTRMFG